MKVWLICCALASAYKVSSPTLMQTDSDSGDSAVDYVDDNTLTEETQTQAEANAAAKSYDNADTTQDQEDDATETAKHNKEAEKAETPQGETDTSEVGDTSAEREVEAEKDPVEYTGSTPDSVRELAISTNSLKKQNYNHDKENVVLEAILLDSIMKLENARIDNSRDASSYQGEIQNQDRVREELDQEANKPEEDEDSQEQPDFEASSAMTFVMGIVLCFFFFQGAQYFLGSQLDSYLEPTLQALFSDVTVLTVLWAVTFIIYYSDIVEEDSFDLKKVLVGLGVFILVWLLLGLWLLFAAQSHSRKWRQIEDECSDMRKLKNSYEEAYNEHRQDQDDKKFKAKRAAMQYAVMRQEFIRPTYQVPVSEIVLRSDFELSEYLSRCLAKIVDDTFQLSWLSYCILVAAVVLWRLILLCSLTTQLVVLIIVPLMVCFVLLTLKSHLQDIYYELVPYILDPYEVHLIDNFSKEPLQNVDKTPRPPYLRGKLPGRQESTEALGGHPLKLTCAFIFGGIFPNRHQVLFYFDSYGPRIILYCLQGIYIISVLWLTVLVLFYVKTLWSMIHAYSIIVIAVSFALWVLVSCVYLSECIRGLCLATKLELMKDREQIRAVVCKGKADRAIRAMKMYRKLKLIYREQNQEVQVSLPAKQQALLIEVYELQSIDGSLPISSLDAVVMLLGFELEGDELRHLAKECEPVKPSQDAKFMISFENLLKAVSRLMSSSQLKPEAVAKRVLRTYFKQMQRRDKVTHLSLTDLE